MESSEPARNKASYIGAPACFALEEALRPICEAFDAYGHAGVGCYIVGSALKGPGWRDVDVRLMLTDEAFAVLFPHALRHSAAWEHDPRWLVLTVAISERLSRITGLPIDFQFQPMTFANEHHKGQRHPVGVRYAEPAPTPDGGTREP